MMILVTIRDVGPLGSQVIIALPIGVSLSPFQMTGIRSFWASTGFGTCLMAIPRATS
jgi:hypothetical protein